MCGWLLTQRLYRNRTHKQKHCNEARALLRREGGCLAAYCEQCQEDNRSTAAVTRKRKHDAMTTTPSTLPISIDEAKITATSTDSSTSMPEVHEASIMHNGVAATGTATASRTGEVKQLPRGTFASRCLLRGDALPKPCIAEVSELVQGLVLLSMQKSERVFKLGEPVRF